MSKEYEEKRGPRGADEHTEKRFPRERRAEERVPMRERDAEADGLIEGRNAVTEALRAGTPIDKIFIARGETDKTLGHIASTARAAGVVVVEADRRKLDYMSATKAHQGVIALAAVREYASVEDILSAARERGEAPLLVVCDEISDPHNLGAIIRTAECAGAHGVIIPKRRSAGLTSIVGKTSAGAVSYLPVARVPNIPALLKELQQQGVWIFGTAAEGTTSLYEADLKGPAAIVIGSETTKSQCSLVRRLTPLPSVPTTMPIGPPISAEHQGLPSMSAQKIHNPFCFNSSMVETMLATRTTGIYSTAPAEVLATVAVSPTPRRLGMMTPCAPAASAVRMMAPRLCGSSMLSQMMTKGGWSPALAKMSSMVEKSWQAAMAATP